MSVILKGGLMLIVAIVITSGWLLAATIGTWAYFAGEGTATAPRI